MKAISYSTIINLLPKLEILFNNKIFLLIIGCFIAGCSAKPDLPDFNEVTWKNDVRSCDNKRPGMVASLRKNTQNLIGLRHNEVIAVLGKPEGNSLEKSGERVYYYFIQPGSQCQNNKQPSTADKVFIRFDALDRAYKVKFDNNL